jgi:hypothetical protein
MDEQSDISGNKPDDSLKKLKLAIANLDDEHNSDSKDEVITDSEYPNSDKKYSKKYLKYKTKYLQLKKYLQLMNLKK